MPYLLTAVHAKQLIILNVPKRDAQRKCKQVIQTMLIQVTLSRMIFGDVFRQNCVINEIIQAELSATFIMLEKKTAQLDDTFMQTILSAFTIYAKNANVNEETRLKALLLLHWLAKFCFLTSILFAWHVLCRCAFCDGISN